VPVTVAPGFLAAAGDTTYALDADVVVRLVAAAVLGGAVGLEREARDQEAGLRTHLAVALGAALFGVISTLGFVEFDRPRAETVLQADVTRVASNVAVGIGFLGAGIIFRQRDSIKNLTTAASLWAVTAIGLACGVGDLLAGLVALRPVRALIRSRAAPRAVRLEVRLRPGADPGPVIDALGSAPLAATDVALRMSDGHLVLSCAVAGPPDTVLRRIAQLAALPGVESIDDE
jgi:putative Mg2+ transporter-C (MgtC) family protein